ncbi:MAG: hypothetical protein WCK18_19200 [Prolixibacteraceae bacterium]
MERHFWSILCSLVLPTHIRLSALADEQSVVRYTDHRAHRVCSKLTGRLVTLTTSAFLQMPC